MFPSPLRWRCCLTVLTLLTATVGGWAQTGPAARVQALLAASQRKLTTDTAASRRTAQQAYALARTAGLDTLSTLAHVQLGMCGVADTTRANWALAHLRAARRSAYTQALRSALARSYRGEGNVEENRKNLAAARTAYGTEIKLWRQMGNQKELATAHNNLGRIYREEGHYSEAMQAYLQGLQLAESSSNQSAQIAILHNLGSLSQLLHDPAAGVEYSRRALTLLNKQPRPDTLVLIGIHSLLSILYVDQQQYQQARPHLQTGIKLARQQRSAQALDWLGYLEYGMGDVAASEQNYRKAERHYLNSANLFARTGLITQQGDALYALAEVQLQHGQRAVALQSARQALALSRQFKVPNDLARAYADFAQFSAKSGDFATAYAYQSRGQAIKDSLFTAEKAEQMAELRTRYESEQKEAQLRQLRGEAALQRAEASWQRQYRNLLAGALLVVGLLGAASYRR
ncbi:tetratricopeptide repeat protein, partial [Hymenobacter saemangeumensis]|uniref:tetratricopeptide repeat protein n=1 Tax=Hymenobacter saemangeumensis TaxID=1084522 RepID=UPI0031E7488B